MKRIYYPQKQAEAFQKDWGTSHLRQEQLPVLTLENAVVTPPFEVFDEANGRRESEAGVFDQYGHYIQNTSISIKKKVSLPAIPIPYIDETVIYCGMLILHYGHFLLQSTARLYYCLKHPELNWRLCFVTGNADTPIPKYIYDFFNLLHIPWSRLLILSSYTRFKTLILPPLSSRYYVDYTEDYILPFQRAAENIPPANHKKIFISRKKWNGLAKCFGEEKLEELFRKNGFHSIMPEQMSLQEQIATFKGAEMIAGINGTAFHNVLFTSGKKQLIFLNRNEEYDSQYIINEALKMDWFLIKVHANPFPVNHAHGPFIVGVTPELQMFCHDFGLNTFGIQFFPDHYIRDFLKYYAVIYAQEKILMELAAHRKGCVQTDELVHALLLQNSIWNLQYERLIYRCSSGIRKKFADLKCSALKKTFHSIFPWRY